MQIAKMIEDPLAETPRFLTLPSGSRASSGSPLFDLGMQNALRGRVDQIHNVAQNSSATACDSPGNPAMCRARGITCNALRKSRPTEYARSVQRFAMKSAMVN